MNTNESECMFTGPAGAMFRRSVTPAESWATLVLVHGYGDHSGRHLPVMRFLAERGVACHALDLRGEGRSAGPRGFVRRWGDYLADVDSFLALPELAATVPRFLLGHSHGGLIVAAAAIRGLPGVAGCVLTSPFFRNRLPVPAYKVAFARLVNPLLPWLRLSSGLSDDMMTSDEAMKADTRADPYVHRIATPRWYLTMLEAQRRVLAGAGRCTTPLLVLCGGDDPIADEAATKAFIDAAGSADKRMKVYPGLRHEILRETSRGEAFSDVAAWLKAHAVASGMRAVADDA